MSNETVPTASAGSEPTHALGAHCETVEDMMISVDRLVEVASRTWPGINQPGGVARVTHVYYEESASNDGELNTPTHVDVSYMVGRSKERKVPIEYVIPAPQYEIHTRRSGRQAKLRDRALLLGRCRRCGSLRTDCGSCDWATETNDLLEENSQGQSSKSKPSSSSSRQPKSSSQTTTKRTILDSSDEDSSTDDEIALRELIRTSRKHYRKHVRDRKKWEALQSNKSTPATATTTNNNKNNNKPMHTRPTAAKKANESLQKKEESVHSYSSSDDEDDLEFLLQRSQARYQTASRQRAKWRRRLGLDQPSISTSVKPQATAIKRRLPGRSVLENLENTSQMPNQQSQPQKTKTKSRRITLDGQTNHGNKQNQGISVPKSKGEQENSTPHEFDTPKKSKPTAMNVDASSPIGVAETSSPESMVLPSRMDASDDELPTVSRREDSNNFFLPYDDNIPIDSNLDESNTLALSQFIQPEGEEAAENLPEDTLDRTKNIPYTQLPDFFEETASELENKIIPDFRFKVASLQRLHRKQKTIRMRPTAITTAMDPGPSIDAILNDCNLLWQEVTQSVIRNGVDQCKAALRLLFDSKLFRKHRHKLSPKERKRLRGSTIMDARNLRLDALEEAVEDLVRSLRDLASLCEDEQLKSLESVGGVASSDDSMAGVDFMEDDYETQDLLALQNERTEQDPDATRLDPSERELADFDPHQHATRKRRVSTSPATATQVTKKRHSNSTPLPTSASSSRRQRQNGMSDFIVADEAYLKRLKSTSSKRKGPVGDGVQSVSRKRSLDGASHTAVDNSPGEPRIDTLHEESADSAAESSNMFVLAETEEADGPSRHDNIENGREKSNVTKSRGKRQRRRRVTSTQQGMERTTDRTARDRLPISQRMQAFLDKNGELDFGDACDEPPSTDVQVHTGSRHSRNSSASSRQTQPTNDSNNHAKAGRTATLDNRASGGEEQTRVQTTEDVISSEEVSQEFLISRAEIRSSYLIAPTSASLGIDIPTVIDHLEQFDVGNPGRMVCHLRDALQILPNAESHEHERLFRALRNVLGSYGTATLTELVHGHRELLEVHIYALICLMEISRIASSLPSHVTLIDFIVLQLVDSLYAIFHPQGWAIEISNRRGVLSKLEILRDALSRNVHLGEAVARCLLEQLKTQKWQLSENKDFAFVSSVESTSLKAFLSSGESSLGDKDTRLKSFGSVLPRIEVEVIWKLLMFVGSRGSTVESKSQVRWQLVSKLFSGSCLAKCEESELSLAPSSLHLSTMNEDLKSFIHVAKMRCLNGLPNSDTFVSNLAKKAILLQNDDYLKNDESRSKMLTKVQTEQSEKSIARLWKSTSSLLEADVALVKTHSISIHDFLSPLLGPINNSTYKHALVPGSGLMNTSLALLYSWMSLLPEKKVRQNRFFKELRSFRSFLEESEKSIADNSKTTALTDFAQAFNGVNSKRAGDPHVRTSLFLRESLALFSIIEPFFLGLRCGQSESSPNVGLSLTIMKEVWDSLSTPTMKELQQSAGDIQSGTSSFEDIYQAYAAARVMSIASCLSLGVPPWDLRVGLKMVRLKLNRSGVESAIDYYSFSLSCVVSSLVCMFESRADPGLIIPTLSSVCFIYNQLALRIKMEGTHPSLNRAATKASKHTIPLLFRCLRLNICSHGQFVHVSILRLLLCAIQSVSTFQATKLSKQAAEVETLQAATASNDHLDEIDDSIFSALDLEHHQSSCPPPTDQDKSTPWELFFDVFRALKPSNRFNLTVSRYQDDEIGAHAKFLLEKEVSKVCDCLVTASAAHDFDEESNTFWEVLTRIMKETSGYQGSEDLEFNSRVFKRIVLGLCSLSTGSASCRSFVLQSSEIVLKGLLQSIMDPDRLEEYPSCNLELFDSVGGDSATREAILNLDIFSGELSSSSEVSRAAFDAAHSARQRHKRRAQSVWKALSRYCTAMRNEMPTDLQELKVISDRRHHSSEAIATDSLEKEVSSCFELLSSLIGKLVVSDAHLFLEICDGCLSSMSSQILRIVQSLRYQEQQYSDRSQDADVALTRAKTMALFESYSELFLGAVALIVERASKSPIARCKTLVNRIRQVIFYPIFRRQFSSMTSNLKCLAATTSRNSSSINPEAFESIPGCASYFESFFSKLLRHARHLLPASTGITEKNTVLHCFMDAMIRTSKDREDSISTLIGDIFSTNRVENNLAADGPLARDVDRILWRSLQNDNDLPLERDELLEQFRSDFFTCAIIPRLRQRNGAVDIKRRVLKVAERTLKHSQGTTESLEVLCDFVRSSRLALLLALKAPTVDDDFFYVTLSCLTAAANLKMNKGRSTLLGFCQQKVSALTISDPSLLKKENKEILFLYSLFRWSYDFAQVISFENQVSVRTEILIGLEAMEKNPDQTAPRLDWSELLAEDADMLSETPSDLESWTRAVQYLEPLVFPPKSEAAINVVNKYLKRQPSTTPNDERQPWNPSPKTSRAAKEFVTLAIAAF